MKRLLLALGCFLAISVCYSQTGVFWGSSMGGFGDGGKIYKLNPDGTGAIVKHFSNTGRGTEPHSTSLILASDNSLYGVTRNGGKYNRGTFYKVDPNTFAFTTLYNFDFDLSQDVPSGPYGTLVELNGYIYGFKGDSFESEIYRIKLDGTAFEDIGGTPPVGTDYHLSYGSGLTKGNDGNLYGLASQYIFKMTPTGSVTSIYSFSGSFNSPGGKLLLASDGRLYGLAVNSLNFSTVIFRVETGGTGYTELYELTQQDLDYFGALVEGPGSILYGVVRESGANDARIFKIGMDGTGYADLYEFTNASKGSKPLGDLVIATDGRLYGSTEEGGVDDAGVLYRIEANGSNYTVVANMSKTTGLNPAGGLCKAGNGDMFVACSNGGDGFSGTIVKVKTDNSVASKVVDFYEPNEGSLPRGRLIQLPNGDLLGTTGTGGQHNGGTLYKIGAGNVYSQLFSFDNENTGGLIYDSPISGPDNYLYGTTYSGGQNDMGTIYKIKTDGTGFVKLLDFNGTNGSQPTASLLLANDGRFYGITGTGGANDEGVIFSINANGTGFTKLFEFGGSNEGDSFACRLVQGTDGFLYGTSGGFDGAVFKIKTNGTAFSVIRTFDSAVPALGYSTFTDLMVDDNGDLIGVTARGGSSDHGVIFRLKSDGSQYTVLHDFDTHPASLNTLGPPFIIKGPLGLYYGVEPNGGSNGSGTAFRMEGTGANYTRLELNFNDNPKAVLTPWSGLTYVIEKTRQTITAANLEVDMKDQPFDISISATSGLPLISSSSDPSILTIANNSITTHAVGTVTVTLKQPGNSQYFPAEDVTITIKVNPAPPEPEKPVEPVPEPPAKQSQTITFPLPATHFVGDAPFQLNATASSNLAVEYSTPSSTISIASGKVTVLKAGRAVVVANQPGNNTFAAAKPVELSFCIIPPRPTITVGGTTAAPILTSSNDTGNQWYFNNKKITDATGKTLAVTQEGTYSVMTIADNCFSAMSQVSNIITAVEEATAEFISVSPNPADDKVDVVFTDAADQPITITLADIFGRVTEQRSARTNSVERFDVQSLARGFYIFKVSNNGVTVSKKFIKR
ncbi:MAG TPA: choice-of-anchor tandem repeat GloVer-containing protein [Cyclobacteriaceae bacterium]|nr:choice-of-anchor tandem repeat GloVer-containing protein [Cyclobacteriaceae bacterium]